MSTSADLLKELRIDRRPGAVQKKRRWPWVVGGLVLLLVVMMLLMGGRPAEVDHLVVHVEPQARDVVGADVDVISTGE